MSAPFSVLVTLPIKNKGFLLAQAETCMQTGLFCFVELTKSVTFKNKAESSVGALRKLKGTSDLSSSISVGQQCLGCFLYLKQRSSFV